MKIQIICHNQNIMSADYKIVYSPFGEPFTFDLFDVNIIDLQDREIWKNDGGSQSELNYSKDFVSLQALIESARKSKCIILLPENYTMCFHRLSSRENHYAYHYLLKDKLDNLAFILNTLLPTNRHAIFKFGLIYELSKTKCSGKDFYSAFCFDADDEIAYTRAEGSGKPTTICYTEKSILTTLVLAGSSLKDFLEELGIKDTKTDYPAWLSELERFDDKSQKDKISESNAKISFLKEDIKGAEEKLAKNLRYKSILTENGPALVEVVFDILQQILSCDLSEFIDKMQEDFLIPLDGVTFVGEIKGVTTNVRNEYISQLEVHRQIYYDKLEDEGREENVKTLLVLNHQRNKPLSERAEVHIKQIEVAQKYETLIISTCDLLTIYEKFLSGGLSREKVLEEFKTQTGLLDLSKF